MSRYWIPDGLFLGSEVLASGTMTNRMLSSNLVRRVVHNVYLPAAMPLTYRMKCEAAAMIIPKGAVITGRSAAALHGLEMARPDEPVEIVVDERFRFGPIAGLQVRRTTLRACESESWGQARIATDRRMALDVLLRHAPRTRPWLRRLRAAVADVDQILHANLLQPVDFHDAVYRRANHGIVLARQALEMVDGRAESPPESEVRVVLTVAGFRPEVQWVVRDVDGSLWRLDLALPEQMVAVEYDGEWHADGAQTVADRDRRDRLRALGWHFVVLRADDLRGSSDAVVERVRRAIYTTRR